MLNIHQALQRVAEHPQEAFSNPELLDALIKISQQLAEPLSAYGARMGYPIDKQEAVNIVLVNLLTDNAVIARHAMYAAQPIAYLHECARRWGRSEWGTRSTLIDNLQIPASSSDNNGLTPLETVCELTSKTLTPLTPDRLLPQLDDMIHWLAVNPPQRLSYEANDYIALHHSFTRWSLQQAETLAKTCWGSRPNQKATSLFGGYLLDERFNPQRSPSHQTALVNYRRRVNTQTLQELLLKA